jgi:hypothetical protein
MQSLVQMGFLADTVLVFEKIGATRRSRTGDLLITNPSLNSPEPRHYQKIREFRDKRLTLFGSFRTKHLLAHGLRTAAVALAFLPQRMYAAVPVLPAGYVVSADC